MGSLKHILIKMKANMKASQGKVEVSQEEMVTTRAGQEKAGEIPSTLPVRKQVGDLDTEIQETQLHA